MRTLDPATHAYSFWEGVPTVARQAFGRLFAASATLTGVAVVQRAVRRLLPWFLILSSHACVIDSIMRFHQCARQQSGQISRLACAFSLAEMWQCSDFQIFQS